MKATDKNKPDRSVLVIFNRENGIRLGRNRRKRLIKLLQKHDLPADIHEATSLNEAKAVAGEASGSYRMVIAAGGDGTVNAIASGLAGTGCHLGILPVGSGNDIVRGLNIPQNLTAALKILKNGLKLLSGPETGRNPDSNVTRNDTATGKKKDFDKQSSINNMESVKNEDPVEQETMSGTASIHSMDIGVFGDDQYFVNTLGVGFDGKVSYLASRTLLFRGRWKYMYGVLRSLFSYRATHFHVEMDDETISGNFLMVTVANGPFEGGGIPIAPEARFFDGQFDVVMIRDTGLIARIPLLLRVLIHGAKEGPRILIRKCRTVTIRLSQPLYIHADGEFVSNDLESITVTVKSGILSVITGIVRPESG